MNTMQIENILKNAPKPSPPPGLKQQLLAGAARPAPNPRLRLSAPRQAGWLRRWWPTLVPTAVALGAATTLTLQEIKIRTLEGTVAGLSQEVAAAPSVAGAPQSSVGTTPTDIEAARQQEEIDRLKATAAQLRAQIAELEQLNSENQQLRAQLAAGPDRLTTEETEALDKARERALSIACINNLKQFGLAVRVWSQDNSDAFPPDVLSMSNELAVAKLLVCPADKDRQAAESWGAFTAANCSYEYLTPSSTNAFTEPTRVLSRCPIHGHIGLCDGSVQSGMARNHPDWLVERDGKLYFEPKNEAPSASTPNQARP
jgi:hypothetical protein